ncbi:MAG: fused MFS/spermidine synthase [Gammaproteobacteria bacterium]|nr:fused MFS/spermidine synthase [Gammaproteobacteria bacterium]
MATRAPSRATGLNARVVLVYALAFCGGFSIMSLELLGGRILAPWFGGSIYVWGSIITVFMLALSLGYLIGGRLSLRAPTLTKFGGILAVAAVILYPTVHLAEPAMMWVFERIEDPRYGSLVASLVLFVAPTVVLGAISPYSVRLLVRQREESGKVAGSLYFVSTLGSALGTLATSFYFVLWFEIDTIVTCLAGLLLGLGALAVAVGFKTQAPA